MEGKPKTTKRTVLHRLAALLVIAVLYVPSMGPAMFVEAYYGGTAAGVAVKAVVQTVYWPIENWLYSQDDPRETFLHQYLMWWILHGIYFRD